MKVDIFTDGGSRNNPGKAAIGVVVKNESQTIFELTEYLGIATNNEAEYQAFIASAKWLLDQQNFNITVVNWKLDSKLVVEQLNKHWKIKEPILLELAKKAWSICDSLKIDYKITYVPRAENYEADALVNQTLDSN